MNDLIRICFFPAIVYESLKEDLRIHLPLVTFLLTVVVLCVLSWFLIAEVHLINDELKELFNDLSKFHDEDMKVWGIPLPLFMFLMFVFVLPVTLVAIMLGVVLFATYFRLAGHIFNQPYTWVQWFGFSMWSMMPTILCGLIHLPVALVVGLEVQPFSPLTWIPSLKENWIASFMSVQIIWTAAIMTVGLRRWTDKSVAMCLTIVLVLYAIPFCVGIALEGVFGEYLSEVAL